VSNGRPPNLLLNIGPGTPETKIAYIAPGNKPRLVHLSIKPEGTLSFRVGAFQHKAIDQPPRKVGWRDRWWRLSSENSLPTITFGYRMARLLFLFARNVLYTKAA
jgi:hypothetical protein